MVSHMSDIKNSVQVKFLELRAKRKGVILNFRKKLEEVKIKQIKDSILNK